ncbi:MAG: DNA polymerase IV [Prevotella sp.]|jgi:DNA polymerase-4|nr:DNA polymerase IV [Prevotella sp.]MCH4181978.1 DNA polymerase IV [Prevotella sp.]MCH4212278.1 DNA polymerase IV [Prevotella sp.]MCH4242087.1 DNA polymerase IV [Prevotella sp.]
MAERKIIHIDMDAFFASIEQRDHPELKGLPVAVGHDSARGVVATASYEARKYGVHSAMSMVTAKRLCPNLVIVEGHREYYSQISQEIRNIFHEYTDLIEPISIDEAFLDVTVNKKDIPLADDIAKAIKKEIKEKLHLTASAGVSYNKFLAKIASDYRKPDGLCTIHPAKALDFIAQLPVEKFWGVGSRTAEIMHSMGVFTGSQLRACSLKHLNEVFGKAGTVFYHFARGIDDRPVVTYRERKSVGCERTFPENISLKSTVIIELYHTVLELQDRLEKSKFEGRTLTLKIKYGDFIQITRSLTQGKILKTKEEILPLAKSLLRQVNYDASHPIRLMGLAVSKSGDPENEKPEWKELDIVFDDW